MPDIPQPLVVELTGAQSPEAPKPGGFSSEVTKHFRETAKWIVGGIIATAGAVLAGSSLTNIGSLDPAESGLRLALAAFGALFGLFSLGVLFAAASRVFEAPSVSLVRLSEAHAELRWAPLRKTVENEFDLPAEGDGSLKDLISKDDERLHTIAAFLPYLYVREQFGSLMRCLPWTILGAATGLGLFAWAANPPEREPPPKRAPAVVINWP